MKKRRDYSREYARFHSKPLQIKRRSQRKKARRDVGLRTGDPREVDHRISLKRGGSNYASNLQITTRAANRSKGG